MRSIVRQVEEERRIFGAADEIDCLRGVALGQRVELNGVLDHVGIVEQHRRRHVMAIRDAPVLIESTIRRQVPHEDSDATSSASIGHRRTRSTCAIVDSPSGMPYVSVGNMTLGIPKRVE